MEIIIDVKDCFKDADLLEILAESVYKPTIEKLNKRAEKHMNNPFVRIFALKQDDKSMGIIVLETSNPKQIEILDFAVKKNDQKNGIGRKLIDFCKEEFKIESMIAETDDDAVGFYRKVGFKVQQLENKYDSEANRYLCKFRKKENHTYIAIDLKSFYASVECVERGLDPLDRKSVV